MPGDYFWGCLESLAASLDGTPEPAEANLRLYEEHWRAMPVEKRAATREQMIVAIAGLSRLNMRIDEN